MSLNETPSSSIVKQEQFEATRKWRNVLKIFYEGMPLLTHRRQLRSYPETFTGKDAVDFAEQIFVSVFPKCSSRDSVRKLLERFLSFGYITNVRDESCKCFSDNATLYRFCDERVAQMLRKEQEDEMNRRRSILLKRSSSVRDRDINDRTERLQYEELISSNTTNLREDLSKMAKLNGRLSISCQDISTLEKQTQNNASPIKKSFGVGVLNNLVSIGRASANLFSLNRSNSDSARARQRRCNASIINSKSLCDSSLSERNGKINVQKECYDSRIALTNNKMCGTTKQSVFKTASSSCSTAAHLLFEQNGHRLTPMLGRSRTLDQSQVDRVVFTDADEFRFWRSAIVNWFTQFAAFHNNNGFFFVPNFSGADVRWNSRRINETTGIVQRLPEQKGELNRDLVVSLRRLGHWTGTTQNHSREGVDSEVPVNDPFGLFSLAKNHFARMAPIIPSEQAKCLLNVFGHFSQFGTNDKTKDQNQKDLRLEKRLFLALRLCSLTFPPQLLRNLQILCKSIYFCCFNAKLMQENCWTANLMISRGKTTFNGPEHHFERSREIVLHELCIFFLPQKTSAEYSKSFPLFKILIENVTSCLIQTPKWLSEEVQKEIKEFVDAGQQPNNRVLSSYCDRIDRKEYEAQSKDSDRHLLGLLDQLLSNENLSSLQKYDQLRKFRLAYPSIYEKRFPSVRGRSTHLIVNTRQNQNLTGKE